jgi:hypothetical protein
MTMAELAHPGRALHGPWPPTGLHEVSPRRPAVASCHSRSAEPQSTPMLFLRLMAANVITGNRGSL